MNLATLQSYAEPIALVGYPSLATLSLVWCGICLTRYLVARRETDAFLAVLLALFTSGFVVTSLALSSVHVIERTSGLLVFRSLFALTGVAGWLFTIRYLFGNWQRDRKIWNGHKTNRKMGEYPPVGDVWRSAGGRGGRGHPD